MSVKDYMSRVILSADKNLSVFEAAKLMVEKKIPYIIVLDGGKPVGIVTEEDLISKVLAADRDPKTTKLSDIMTTPLLTIDPDATLSEAAAIMSEKRVRKLPVVRDGIIYGVLTTQDVANYLNDYVDRVLKDILKFRPSLILH
ncbi:MAG: CBS domain-containing protein [archaeon YNP-LCB-003-016]|jgi:CBS domain-containing protein|uniref:CBS domain-containing protein n=1 Tax=Candidatus Culexarchaeum yellowstonense TaxID=2928963 RepID=UPI0026E92375|nr:CBS domain-containing protein [Candidatus Culexarchaeum yellowstonense]MCR6690810.1 CBS domain-containing protein [Candidatus Culexarchaeum yellowstonense]